MFFKDHFMFQKTVILTYYKFVYSDMVDAPAEVSETAAHSNVLAVHKSRMGMGPSQSRPLPAPTVYAPRP